MADLPTSAPSRGDHPALSLYQLIGAPLHALVDAEQQAAQATANYIREMGFLGPDEAVSEGDYGGLRMVRFQHERRAPDGRRQSVRVEVPFLSMIPIPALQIRDAELEFLVKVVDIASMPAQALPAPAAEGAGDAAPEAAKKSAEAAEAARKDPFLSKLERDRVQFRAALSRQPGPSSRGTLEMQIHMKIRVEQADVPAGMAKLFNLLEQNVRATEVEERPEPEEH